MKKLFKSSDWRFWLDELINNLCALVEKKFFLILVALISFSAGTYFFIAAMTGGFSPPEVDSDLASMFYSILTVLSFLFSILFIGGIFIKEEK